VSGFTSKQVVAFTGISPRQLQWWDEQGIVSPERAGRQRLYSLDDLAEVSIIWELRRKGFSLQRVRKVLRFLQREFGRRLVQTIHAEKQNSGADVHLLTDGTRIYVETSPQQVIDILKDSRQPIFTVCLTDAVRRIQSSLNSRRPARSASVPARRRRGSA
jgi:DNA-binding transcriptional MerR regulator